MYSKYVRLRDFHKMTDYQVAKQTGITKSTFTDWKTGRSMPGVRKLQKIAKLFDVPMEYFLS